jgi:hypothetical protein
MTSASPSLNLLPNPLHERFSLSGAISQVDNFLTITLLYYV